MRSQVFATSSTHLPIPAFQFGRLGPKVLVLGGVHGDEIEGVWAAHGLLQNFAASFAYRLQLTLVPCFNLDGVLSRTRQNARGVDLNRNLPTKDWTAEVAQARYHPGPYPASEPENQGLVSFIAREEPQFILSLHSWKPLLNVNGNCFEEALEVQRHTQAPIDESIGYPTPGCLGTFAGLERGIPTLTYEIERGLNQEAVQSLHLPAILEALKVTERTHSQSCVNR